MIEIIGGLIHATHPTMLGPDDAERIARELLRAAAQVRGDTPLGNVRLTVTRTDDGIELTGIDGSIERVTRITHEDAEHLVEQLLAAVITGDGDFFSVPIGNDRFFSVPRSFAMDLAQMIDDAR